MHMVKPWAVKDADSSRLECNDMRIISEICNVALKDRSYQEAFFTAVALGNALEEADS